MTDLRESKAPFSVFGKAQGATRIWMTTMTLPPGFSVGLHRHGGDEILQVLAGAARFHVNGKNIDIEAGGAVVVPPFTEHAFRILTPDTMLQVAGEIEMGEWVTVIEPDGSHHQVEAKTRIMPWSRLPAEGEDGVDFDGLMALFSSTISVLDEPPGVE